MKFLLLLLVHYFVVQAGKLSKLCVMLM